MQFPFTDFDKLSSNTSSRRRVRLSSYRVCSCRSAGTGIPPWVLLQTFRQINHFLACALLDSTDPGPVPHEGEHLSDPATEPLYQDAVCRSVVPIEHHISLACQGKVPLNATPSQAQSLYTCPTHFCDGVSVMLDHLSDGLGQSCPLLLRMGRGGPLPGP